MIHDVSVFKTSTGDCEFCLFSCTAEETAPSLAIVCNALQFAGDDKFHFTIFVFCKKVYVGLGIVVLIVHQNMSKDDCFKIVYVKH